jgi:cytochrome bd-I ubiquinol oxidase subunit X
VEFNVSHGRKIAVVGLGYVGLPVAVGARLHRHRLSRAARRSERRPGRAQFLQHVLRVPMWYFTWILGVGFACMCGILNALWHEQYLPDERIED